MKKQFDEYHLLHKHRRYGSLWLGNDHLLVIEKNVVLTTFRETYRRLDYDQIQAIFTAPSKIGKITAIMSSLALLFFGLFGTLAIYSDNVELGGFLIFFAIIFAIYLVIALITFLLYGKTAGLVVHTAVRSWRLPQIKREKPAKKVFQSLAERCATTQGGILERLPEQGTSPVTQPPQLPEGHRFPEEHNLSPHPTLYYGYAALLLAGTMVAGECVIHSVAYTIAMMLVGVVAFILLCVGVGRRGGMQRTGSKGAWIFSIVSLVLLASSLYVLVIMQSLGSLNTSNQQLAMLRALAEFPRQDTNEVLTVCILALCACCAVAAVVGLVAAQRYKRTVSRLEESSDSSPYMKA